MHCIAFIQFLVFLNPVNVCHIQIDPKTRRFWKEKVISWCFWKKNGPEDINDDLDDLFDIWLLLFREGLMMFFLVEGGTSEQQGETVDKYSPCR